MQRVRLTFLGAAGTVTGSRYLLEYGERQLLIDCGLFQGYKQLRLRNWAEPTFDPERIEAVVLTHAHIDHSGYLPILCRKGFSGRIYCSPAALDLSHILLPDSAHLQEEDAKYANRHGLSKHHPALPLYTQEDVARCLRQFSPAEFDSTFEPVPGIRARLRYAGHMLGAASVRTEADGMSLTFTGDLGRADDPLLRAPAMPEDTDYLVTESTYGDRSHPAVDPERELAAWLKPACERRGVIVVPTFAVGRAQALLFHIAQLKERGELPDIPVYLDSPMALDATALYVRHAREHRLSEPELRRMCTVATLVRTPDHSKSLDQRKGPMIIIAGSGMATGGRVIHHIKAFIGDPANLVLFAGFQAPGTRGAALTAGAGTVRIHGMELPVRAQIGQLQASSAHADADELLGWMRQLSTPPRQVFVTHGEPGASDALRYRIEHELGWNAVVPEYRDTILLSSSATPRR